MTGRLQRPARQRRLGGGAGAPAAAWAPSDLTDQLSIFDERQQQGSPIDDWLNQAGGFVGLTASGIGRPATGRTINTQPAPDFDGGNTVMFDGAVDDAIDADGFHIFIVAVLDSCTAVNVDPRFGHAILADNSDYFWITATLDDVLGVPTPMIHAGFYDGVTLKDLAAPFTVGVPFLLDFSFNSARIRLQVGNGPEGELATAGNVNAVGGLLVMGNTATGVYVEGAYGTFLSCGSEQSAPNRAGARGYCGTKYAVSV